MTAQFKIKHKIPKVSCWEAKLCTSLDPRPFWPCKEGFGEQPFPEVSWGLEWRCWCWCGKECTWANKCSSSTNHRSEYTVEHGKFENWSCTWRIALKIWKQSLRGNPARHFRARLFSRSFLAWAEGSGVQTSCVWSSKSLCYASLPYSYDSFVAICWIVWEHNQGSLRLHPLNVASFHG